MSRPRIAFVGAGSVVFTKNLLGDILEHPELRACEIALHDIDPDRLATAKAMAEAVAREREASPEISVHPNSARRSRAPTTCSTWYRSAATGRRSSTSRSRRASGSAR